MTRNAALCVMTAVLGACASSTPGPGSAQLPEGPTVGTLRKLDGTYFTLDALRGSATLITFIQTWSDHALVEVSLLDEVAERYGDRLTVLCVALDEQPEMVQIFMDTFHPSYEVVQAADATALTGPNGPFGPITMIPTSVLLDVDGRVAARMDGMWRPPVLRKAVERLVGSIEKER